MDAATAAEQQVIAAWIQAIGSIAAIGVAIWVSYWQNKRQKDQEEKKETDEVQNMLLSLRDEVEALWNTFDHVIGKDLKASERGTAFAYTWPVEENPFVIYQSHADRISKVTDHELRRLIIVTYARALGLLQSFRLNNQLIKESSEAHLRAMETGHDVHVDTWSGSRATLERFGDQLRDECAELERYVEQFLEKLPHRKPPCR